MMCSKNLKLEFFVNGVCMKFLLCVPFLLFSDLSLYWWKPDNGTTNFGDELSKVIVERIVHQKMDRPSSSETKFLAVGSILHFAKTGDIIWGAGINGKHLTSQDYQFSSLDVRSIRGPLTRDFLTRLGIHTPEVYGDPVLLFSQLFPEFKPIPIRDFLIIPHISEMHLFRSAENVVFPTENWEVVLRKILESRFVISSSLHGIILAESFKIPAKLLRITANEPLFKFADYYFGSGRKTFSPASSIEEALKMGGEPSHNCDLDALFQAFPFDVFAN